MSLRPTNTKRKKNTFGATAPPFIDYLKEILRRYPDGGQILKELIQNADDAGASKTVFIHDERKYGCDSIWSPALGKYQGAALYAFNDAVFTDEDWEGIQRAGRSIKHDDPTKVGRFGIGFNSIYHVTDLPCVLSSKHLAVFDPQKLAFDDELEGYRWSLDDKEDRQHILKFSDQFKPFQDIVNQVCESDCAWEKITNECFFKGTLFRFPLRHEASEISDNLYDSEKATQLFDSFIPDADISVLFLRSVSSISLLHIDSNGRVTNRMNVSASSKYSPNQESEVFGRNLLQGKTSFKTVSCIPMSLKTTTSEWLVTACRLTEGQVPEIDALAGKLSFYPQVDVAFRYDPNGARGHGRLSCFLPLPNNETNGTGLPVHINACFGLTDNRRYIKWQEVDQKNDESAVWNELLMERVLPHVYLKIIQDGIQLSRKSVLSESAVYNLWPDPRETRHRPRWHQVAVKLFRELFQKQEIFCLANDKKKWVAASQAVFQTNGTGAEIMSAVFRLLVKEGENLVSAPEHVLLSMRENFPYPNSLKWVTPSLVRSVLRKSDMKSICKDDKLSILEYVLSDGKYEELNGLQLLPLSDGTFRFFTNREEDTALIDNENFSRALLPFCKGIFLPVDLNRDTLHRLRGMATMDSRLYRLINLDAKNVAEFAKKHLPRDWKETTGHIKWNSVKDDHPPKTWLKEFWKFLNVHWADLREFIGMPLIPLEPIPQAGSTVTLARLEAKSTLIFQSSIESTLSHQMQKVVSAVGGTVIKKDECLKHHDIENYVLSPSPRNVLRVLLNLDITKVVSCFSTCEKEEFKTYISSLGYLSDAEQVLLSALPIFRLMSERYVASKSKRAVNLMSNPAIPKDLPVPDTVVQCATDADRRLLTLLEVELLDAAQLAIYLVDLIDERYFSKDNEQKIMAWILNNGQLLFFQSKLLLRKSKSLHFIHTAQGDRKRPSSVFDPANKTFLDLFGEDFFPPQVYRSPNMLQSLKQLGLQTKIQQLRAANVLHVALQIQKLHIHSPDCAFKKADVLIRILNENDLLCKFSEIERQAFLQLQWVPCENPDSIQRNSQNRCLYKPTEIRASKYSAIVGHVMPLVSDLNESMCQKLGLNSPPPAEKVLENLYVLISLVPSMEKADSDYEFKNKLHGMYGFMQENIEHFKKELNNKGTPWLWSQTEFVPPQKVVLTYPTELDLSLYIKKVADEFLQYEHLLRECGVKETLSDQEIEAVLVDLQKKIDDRTPPYGEPSELKLSTAILDWMRKNKKTIQDFTPVPVMAENRNFRLRPLKDTVYCDISADGLDDLKQDDEEYYVIHEEVPRVTARWLNIPLSSRILNAQTIGFEDENQGIEQCGQTEPITQRIKNILKEYDDERDIFKELIQNAEDASASSCGFILDFRTHSSKGLIDDGMALCNGPCLWAFNDELFSEDDWKNIVRVGAASKENQLEKIGKFGLGFNAVYHVTDIPSILSGKYLLILDPNVTHLETLIRNKSNPGIKLDLSLDRLFRRFPGQFQSYQGIFDCDLLKNNEKFYKGTLIKLPFRTAVEAYKSEISSKVYDEQRINAFQQSLAKDALTPLLFLKHLRLLSLQIFKREPIESILKISKTLVHSIKVSKEWHLQDMEEVLQNSETNHREFVDCSAANIVEIIRECAEGTDTQYWFLYSCFGTKASLTMFQKQEHPCKFSLPISGVAAPLQRHTKDDVWSPDEKHVNGQAFCFLPLPIDTGLPVHINGSFAVTSNRKALWETGIKHEWNKALLQDAGATAYITVLLELKKMAQNGNLQNYDYYKFWPNIEKVSKTFKPLVTAFYIAIVQSSTVTGSLELLSNGTAWCSFDNARFLDPSIEENGTVGKLAMEVFLKYTEASYCAVPLPAWARRNLIQCGFGEMLNERTFSWLDFYEIVFTNLNKMDAHSRNALVLNAIDLNDCDVNALLKSNACIPTEKVGTLQFTDKLVNPHGKVACLYEPTEGRFLSGTIKDYFATERIRRLSDLGMLTDVLPLEDVIERAKTIPQVWAKDKNKAGDRLECLFDSMKKSRHVDSPLWETLKHISFLPASGTNQSNEVMTVLNKPCNVYNCQCSHLVSMTEFTVDFSKLGLSPDDQVLTKLGVMIKPPIETVLAQLKEVHRRVKLFENSVRFNIANRCYDYLNKYLLNDGVPNAIVEHVQSIPFVLIEDRFVNVQKVAICGQLEPKPYLFLLPSGLKKFENLWSCVGIKSEFTAEQFVAVLEEIGELSGKLSTTDLHVCHDILVKGLYENKHKTVNNCLMLDVNCGLTKSSELKYNDTPWMPVQAGVTFCHELISRAVACWFGVVTTRHHTLQNHLVSGFLPFAKEFGQNEKLTTRIKNIIQAYPSKKDILKELIQNADDAEATEIHFVWDNRKHGTTQIFGESWELLQGPALCVYNNKKFSNEDLKGIQQLGAGGKHGTLGRTGKYGLGFNSVYQLTDCPSILTGDEYLCICDPNLLYVETGTKESPGCMYSMDEIFKKFFHDVYHTFLPDQFPLHSGTMFRLPLRTKEMAEKSEISLEAVGDKDIAELFNALKADSDELILFLKNVRKIYYRKLGEDGSDVDSFVIEKKVMDDSVEQWKGFCNHVRNSLQSGMVIPHQAIYKVQIASGKKKRHYIVAEQYGSSRQNQDEYAKVPQAGVAACSDIKADEFHGKAFCSLPLPGETGLPVHVNGNFEVDFSRRDLWKEDGESSKTQWNQLLKVKTVAPLYADLLTNICKRFKKGDAKYLRDLKPHLNFCLRYFPVVSKDIAQAWHDMINEVYRVIQQQNLPVIPTLRSVAVDPLNSPAPKYTFDWSSVSKPDSTDAPHFISDALDAILHVLEHIGMKLVPYSWTIEKITRSFKTAGVAVAEVSPSSVIVFLRKKRINDRSQTPDDLPLPINQTLIKDSKGCLNLLKFCLSDVTKDSGPVDLNGLPLLLTQDQMLRKFSVDSPKLISKFADVFKDHKSEFVDYQVNSCHSPILKKGKYVNNLTVPLAAKFAKPVLQQLLQQSLFNETNGLHTAEKETKDWLKHLWRFFDAEVKHLKPEEENQVFSEIKRHFSDCQILPVIYPGQKVTFLQKIGNIQSIVGNPEDRISAILFKLGFMKIETDFVLGLGTLLYRHVQTEMLNTNNCTAVLQQLVRILHSCFEKLSGDESDQLQYFLQSSDDIKTSNEYQGMFKSLPLFQTICGKRQRIDFHQNVFILNSEFHNRFLGLYMIEDKDCIFLKYSLTNGGLTKCLNIEIMNDLKYCVKFVIPSVHKLAHAQVLDLIKLLVELREKPDYTTHQNSIAQALKDVRFIQDIKGSLQTASFFFDDTVNLYKVMLSEEKFVPKAFLQQFETKQVQAKYLLHDVGLKHDVSEEDIIQFAHQVESDARSNTDIQVLKCRSETLLKAAVHFDAKKSKKLLQNIATIKFIVPVQIESKLCDYHKAFAQGTDLVAIKGSLLEQQSLHQHLIWTAMPILPTRSFKQNGLDNLKNAGALNEPPSQQVIQNLKNICRSPCRTTELIETRATVFNNTYAYLQSEQSKPTTFDKVALADVPLVLVENGKDLAKASQVVLTLQHADEFRPYLYSIQSKQAIYEEFFKKIGVEEKPTIAQFCTVLEEIYTECSDKTSLQPNQLSTVQRAVQLLFCLINEKENVTDFPNTLYLPSTDGKLYESSTLFFNDTYFQANRLEDSLKTKLKLLVKLSQCHLEDDPYEHQKLVRSLPLERRPQLLSLIISMNLVDTLVERCDYGKSCEFSGWFQNHLLSRAFHHGLICLIREQSKGTTSHTEAEQMCQRTFGGIRMVCCKSLRTNLLLHHQPLEGTENETQVYVDKQEEECVFYLKHSDNMSHKVVNEVNMYLTKEINVLLENTLNSLSLLVLGQLLLCEDMDDVKRVLEQHEIRNTMSEENGFGFRPSPGTPISDEWHDSLDMDFLNNFEKGEYVGFKTDELENEYVFAIVVERLDDQSGDTRRNPSRYGIQIGNDQIIEVSSLDLYQFKREQRSARDGNVTCTDVVHKPSRLDSSPTKPLYSEPSQSEPTWSSPLPKKPLPQTLEEVKTEIDQSLEEIWKMSVEDKTKAIRRLYLRWHPDKNPDNVQLATEAFKYLKNRIEELEHGKAKHSTSTKPNTAHWGNFRHSYDRWNFEAGSHKRGRERFYKNNFRHQYNFWSHFSETPRPNREEAKRWYRQAQCDLGAAQSDTGHNGSPEWCLFKVHQAVEKALIATEFRRTGKHPGTSSSITCLAQTISRYAAYLKDVPLVVNHLRLLGVDAKRTQYPTFHQSPNIPNGQFKCEDALEAVDLATKLLIKLNKYITE